MGRRVTRKELPAADAEFRKALLEGLDHDDRLLDRAGHESRSKYNAMAGGSGASAGDIARAQAQLLTDVYHLEQKARATAAARAAPARRAGAEKARSTRWQHDEARDAEIRAKAPAVYANLKSWRAVARHFRINRKTLDRIMGR